MKKFSTWLIVMLVAIFWGFRIIVMLTSELGMNFGGFEPLNKQAEIILLFVTLACIILIVKRKIVGALIYLLSYGMYFGVNLFDAINMILSMGMEENTLSSISVYANAFSSLIGIALPIAVLFDMLLDKNQENNPKDNKTDWFYNNKEFDRKLDEREDKNNYRTL